MAVAKAPVRTDNCRTDYPSVPVHQIGFQMAEGEKVGNRTENILVQPTNKFETNEAAKDPIEQWEHHNRRKEEDPTKGHLFCNTRPDTDEGTTNKLFEWRIESDLNFSEDQEKETDAESPGVPWPSPLHGIPKVPFRCPEFEKSKGFDKTRPEKNQSSKEKKP